MNLIIPVHSLRLLLSLLIYHIYKIERKNTRESVDIYGYWIWTSTSGRVCKQQQQHFANLLARPILLVIVIVIIN